MGHAGTLDPLASGVLLVCLGRKATREVPRLQALDKEYEGTVLLGIQTDSDDREGKIIREGPVPEATLQEVQEAVSHFVGEFQQIPPVFSALVVKGRKSYHLARRGRAVRPEPRNVVVTSIEVTSIALPRIGLRVVCGKGTYIRALARDLGERLGTCGMLESLVRTRIGPYRLNEAWTWDALSGLAKEGKLERAVTAFP